MGKRLPYWKGKFLTLGEEGCFRERLMVGVGKYAPRMPQERLERSRTGERSGRIYARARGFIGRSLLCLGYVAKGILCDAYAQARRRSPAWSNMYLPFPFPLPPASLFNSLILGTVSLFRHAPAQTPPPKSLILAGKCQCNF